MLDLESGDQTRRGIMAVSLIIDAGLPVEWQQLFEFQAKVSMPEKLKRAVGEAFCILATEWAQHRQMLHQSARIEGDPHPGQ